jgi:tetratricopeptide (TPR) repeat protein
MRRFSLRLAPSLLLVPALLIAGSAVAQTPDQPMPAPVPPAITPEAPTTPIPAPAPAPAAKEAAIEQVPLNPPEAQSIDQMLNQLKRERDPDAARVIANATMAAWSESNSPTVDLLMQWSAKAAAEKRNAAALDFIDQAITLKPDFVGGWNQRATLHFTMGNYKKSVSDIERVLKLEPRHFGAIAGLAGILTERGSKQAAMQAWERYLDIYPADREAQEIVAKLSEELAGQKT